MEYYGVIYKIVNLINNKIYIGMTTNLEKRIKQHFKASEKGTLPLYKAIRKYGKDNFVVELVDTADSKKELCQKEIYYIEYYNSFIQYNGYNIATGGNGGDLISHHPDKEKLSQIFSEHSKKNWSNEQYRQKLLNYSKQRDLTSLHAGGKNFWQDEIKKQQYIAKNLVGNNNPFYGKHHSESTKEKIRLKNIGRPSVNKGKTLTLEHKAKTSIAKAYELSFKQWYELIVGYLNGKTIIVLSQELNLSRKIITNRLKGVINE